MEAKRRDLLSSAPLMWHRVEVVGYIVVGGIGLGGSHLQLLVAPSVQPLTTSQSQVPTSYQLGTDR